MSKRGRCTSIQCLYFQSSMDLQKIKERPTTINEGNPSPYRVYFKTLTSISFTLRLFLIMNRQVMGQPKLPFWDVPTLENHLWSMPYHHRYNVSAAGLVEAVLVEAESWHGRQKSLGGPRPSTTLDSFPMAHRFLRHLHPTHLVTNSRIQIQISQNYTWWIFPVLVMHLLRMNRWMTGRKRHRNSWYQEQPCRKEDQQAFDHGLNIKAVPKTLEPVVWGNMDHPHLWNAFISF